jgi:serine/threonine-protein kinase
MQADIQRAASGVQVAAMAPPPTRADYYGYPEPTQRMGAQTMMAPGTQAMPPYQQGGGYGGYDRGGYDDDPRRKRRWIPWLIGAIVVIAAIVVAAMLLTSNGKSYFVPSVYGLSQSKAMTEVKDAGFSPTAVGKNSASVAKGKVISTNPAEGSSAPKGSQVVVYVSEGQAQVTVPPIQQGEAASEAEAALSKAGLQYTLKQDQTSTQPQGTIDHISPPSGTSVTPNSFVKLYVSGGGVQVQSYVGFDANAAENALRAKGLQVNLVSQASNSGQFVPANQVWKQTPDSGVVPSNSVVTLYVQPQSTPTSSPSPSATASPSSSASPSATATPAGGGPSLPVHP